MSHRYFISSWGLEVHFHELQIMVLADHLRWPIDVVKRLSVRERTRYCQLLDAKVDAERAARTAAAARAKHSK